MLTRRRLLPLRARVRARLRAYAQDEAVLWAAGGAEAALTAASSSRWAGAITRTSEDQFRLAGQNLRAGRSSLQARIGRIGARLAVPAGGRAGRTRGYATAAERHAKTIRLRSH